MSEGAQLPSYYTCPSCGWPGLEQPSYASIGEPPWPSLGDPPYEDTWGRASYEVCLCCGFEFGNDDNPGTAASQSFEAYRADWVRNGCKWFDPSAKPSDWNVDDQLARIGVAV